MIDVCEYAIKNDLVKYSVIADKRFRNFWENVDFDVAVEIGTYKGLSTALIAQFARRVHTFDTVDYREKYRIWKELKVSRNISFYLIKSRTMGKDTFTSFAGTHIPTGKEADIKTILDKIKFDIAFIDGEHNYKNVKADFELVKKCGRVLFHDVDPQFVEVNKFVREIGTKINGNIGYWEKDKCWWQR